MFLPFDIGEIHGILELVYKVIDIGWGNVYNSRKHSRPDTGADPFS